MRLFDLSRLRKLAFLLFVIILITKYAALPLFRALRSNKCHSVKSILFLKTHKTGGSSVANILFRFARGKDLRVALPRSQIFSFYWPWSFQVNFVDNLPSEKPDILCSHARYNQTSMRLLMPPDTKFFTILRHPISRFESAFLFEDIPALLGISSSSNPFYQILHRLDRYKSNVNTMYTLRNGMSFDLGLEPEDFENTQVIRNFISSVERDFDLVLLLEYFDESLVLLKHHFCWSLEDVLYLRHNARVRSFKKHHIPKQFRDRFLQWNKADVFLYQHFNRTFWKKVDSQGENFWHEVHLLRKRSLEMKEECLVPGEHRDKKSQTISKLVLNPNIGKRNQELCEDLVKDEESYLNFFRGKQLQR